MEREGNELGPVLTIYKRKKNIFLYVFFLNFAPPKNTRLHRLHKLYRIINTRIQNHRRQKQQKPPNKFISLLSPNPRKDGPHNIRKVLFQLRQLQIVHHAVQQEKGVLVVGFRVDQLLEDAQDDVWERGASSARKSKTESSQQADVPVALATTSPFATSARLPATVHANVRSNKKEKEYNRITRPSKLHFESTHSRLAFSKKSKTSHLRRARD